MQFKKITYQRVKNLGNYESERLKITVELNEDEDVDKAIADLKTKACEALGLTEFVEPTF